MRSSDVLTSGREAYARSDWTEAYKALSAADQDLELTADDLRKLAVAATLTGHDDLATDASERAHQLFLEGSMIGPAVRVAFWLGMLHLRRGEHAPGAGWISRAQQLLERTGHEGPEHGYVKIAGALRTMNGGDVETALAMFDEVKAIADRFDDPDLMALSRLGRGQALVALADTDGAAEMFDAAMVAVTAGDVSPIPAGIVYCGVIIGCRQMFDLRRAQEWTAALNRWASRQPGLQPYRGQCLVHRSEIMQLHGDWSEAMEAADRACAHIGASPTDPVMGMARYQQAELLRLRGEFARSEESYRQASEWGHPVQPGLALLRLAQGRLDDAESAIRRVVEEAAEDRMKRSRVLSAFVEITLATGDLDAARVATDELEELAADLDAPYLHAVAASARGAVVLADGDPQAACVALRRAWSAWQELDAPYEAARVRLRMAEACRELGDDDTADMELDAARRVLEALGAAPDLARIAELSPAAEAETPGGLTPREVEVLRLVATGATNREVADTLVISEKTVARHLSNMFTKLGISSRAAATAWAYEHDVV